jgi:Tfp pilus assembly protein PilF
MKKIYFFLLLAAFAVLPLSCRNNPEKEQQKSTDLVTTKTLGLAYLEEFKLEEAETEFLKFIGIAPKEKLGYANLGLTYLRMGRYPEAQKQLSKAIKIDPRDPDIRLILATVYQMNDERDRAITELKEALAFALAILRYCMIFPSFTPERQIRCRKKNIKTICLNLLKRHREMKFPSLA